MKQNISDLQLIYPENLFIRFSDTDRQKALEKLKSDKHLNFAARKNTYLNYLCLNIFLKYLAVEKNIELPVESDKILSFWSLFNGTAIDIGETRLVIIPSDNNNFEFKVPREWLDIPELVGNYYLAIEMNLDEGWLQLTGYATYEQLKLEGHHNVFDETYTLSVEELIENIDIIWTVQEIDSYEQPKIKPLSTVTSKEVEILLNKLSLSDYYLPRLDLPFSEWATLVGKEKWRQKLQSKLNKYQSVQTSDIRENVVNLRQWFDRVFSAGWDSLETVFSTESKNLAFNFRAIPSTISRFTMTRVKLVDLGIELGEKTVVLLIGLNQVDSEKIEISVQLHPNKKQNYLPESIKVALLCSEGEILQQSSARSYDRFIQLKQFTCPQNQSFSILIQLNEYSFQEDFVC